MSSVVAVLNTTCTMTQSVWSSLTQINLMVVLRLMLTYVMTGLISLWPLCILKLSLSTESTGRVSREGVTAAADGGPGSGGFGEDFGGGTGPHSARHEAPTRVLAGAVQHEPQSSQVPVDNEWVQLFLSEICDQRAHILWSLWLLVYTHHIVDAAYLQQQS